MSSAFPTVDKAETLIASLRTKLLNENLETTSDLAPCGLDIVAQLQTSADLSCGPVEAHHILEHLEIISEDAIKSSAGTTQGVPLHFRRLYTDCRLIHSLVDLRYPATEILRTDAWLRAVRRLDMAIIVAGAAGDGRLDLILDTIELIQSEHLPLIINSTVKPISPIPGSVIPTSLPAANTSLAPNLIPRISPPSLSAFCNKFSAGPFILPGFVCDWPAFDNHPWASFDYLRQIAGRGRIVPVEVGSDYRTEEWDQKLMSWEEFLHGIGLESNETVDSEAVQDDDDNKTKKRLFYLAQHTLLTQFPALRSDIIVPDYVYASLRVPSTFPAYHPPGNEEQLVINAWLGPSGTVSPAHTDPYFNCFAQVMGRKTIWLAPPHLQDEMYPCYTTNTPHTTRERQEDSSSGDAKVQKLKPSLANTSCVDVFKPSDVQFPLFARHVKPHALCGVLEPGDMLFIPAGWWHAIRSEDISFSVSMWF